MRPPEARPARGAATGAATTDEARSDEARRANEANILSKELAKREGAGRRGIEEKREGGVGMSVRGKKTLPLALAATLVRQLEQQARAARCMLEPRKRCAGGHGRDKGAAALLRARKGVEPRSGTSTCPFQPRNGRFEPAWRPRPSRPGQPGPKPREKIKRTKDQAPVFAPEQSGVRPCLAVIIADAPGCRDATGGERPAGFSR